jgi:4'-phosphopantetheinyl transferase
MSYASQICTGWVPRPSVPPMPKSNQVHVWRVRTCQPGDFDWRSILSAEEQDRAGRFLLTGDRQTFAVTRTALRTILAQYLGFDPQSIRFGFSTYGKPTIPDPSNTVGLTFNVSHSGDWALLAFGVSIELGVDVECLRIERNVAEIAKRFYPPHQVQEFLTQPAAMRKRDFLQAWTRREAVGKALGVGISIATETFDSAMAGASQWSIQDIEVDGDHVAAVAARTRDIKVRLWDYQS